MKYLPLFALTLLLVGCNPSCKWKQQHKGGEVTALGYGEIKVAPDMAELTLEVANTKSTMKEALAETQKTVNEVLAACAKAVSDTNDVKTARISTGRQYEWERGTNVFKGYSASQTIQVKLRDLSKIQPLTEALLELPVSGINDLQFGRSDLDSLRGEANALAMVDAKKNVQKMCAAVQLECPRLLSARTTSGEAAPMFQAKVMDNFAARASAPGGISVKPGLMTFSATVEATFRAK